ncbi:translation initiation factor IF-3 [Paenibacillus yonginensis]|uniref:Translation initiation factor IF-3 n=1 Tax=Paenibacillus yonginensis TaxID=1462996 RepID=A0A1B1N5F8_9BACL|nr:translation initiation factor IF-3 [Paenibacillus yonginensis]ANS76670.1 translation initiation factor IF-3 [Paenibacillus yonginensis]
MIKNEKIKASEVRLTGLDGEDLGIMPTLEALALARKYKVDLVCESLMSSPPPCRLVGAGKAREERDQAKKKAGPAKSKELRFTPEIEEHDYDTKKRQAEKWLQAGHSVLLTVKISGKQGEQAKALLQQLQADLKTAGRPRTGIQLSGRQAQVELESLT